MEMQEVISRAERNIRQALSDYEAHTRQTDVLDDVTDTFVRVLARDSSCQAGSAGAVQQVSGLE